MAAATKDTLLHYQWGTSWSATHHIPHHHGIVVIGIHALSPHPPPLLPMSMMTMTLLVCHMCRHVNSGSSYSFRFMLLIKDCLVVDGPVIKLEIAAGCCVTTHDWPFG